MRGDSVHGRSQGAVQVPRLVPGTPGREGKATRLPSRLPTCQRRDERPFQVGGNSAPRGRREELSGFVHSGRSSGTSPGGPRGKGCPERGAGDHYMLRRRPFLSGQTVRQATLIQTKSPVSATGAAAVTSALSSPLQAVLWDTRSRRPRPKAALSCPSIPEPRGIGCARRSPGRPLGLPRSGPSVSVLMREQMRELAREGTHVPFRTVGGDAVGAGHGPHAPAPGPPRC